MKILNNRLLHKYILNNIWWVLLCLGLIVLADVCRVWAASRVETIVDLLSVHSEPLQAVIGFVLLSALIMSGYYIFRYIYQVLSKYLSCKLETETRVRIASHLTKISFRDYEKFVTGDVQSTIRNDVTKASNVMHMMIMLITNMLLVLLTGGYMIYVNVKAGIVVVAVSIAVSLINQCLLRFGKRYLANVQTSIGDMTGVIETSIHGMDTVKTYGAQDYAKQFFMRSKREYNKNMYRWAAFFAARDTIVATIRIGGMFGAMLYLGFLGIRGEMSLGQIFVFITLLRDFIMPLEGALSYTAGIAIASVSWGRIGRILDIPEDPHTERAEPYHALDEAQIHDICFSYDGSKPILDHFSLGLYKGNSHVLRGESGCGKSTLLKIITGLYAPKEGCFYADGTLAERSRFSASTVYVAANNPLFSLSLYDNITLGDTKITKEQCMQLADALGIGEWIRTLPDGLDTMVTENGNNLSGGQRQMVNNMRALLSDAAIVIFDEPTSALDKEKEARFSAAVDRLKMQRLVLITSHRGDVISSCDKVYNL